MVLNMKMASRSFTHPITTVVGSGPTDRLDVGSYSYILG